MSDDFFFVIFSMKSLFSLFYFLKFRFFFFSNKVIFFYIDLSLPLFYFILFSCYFSPTYRSMFYSRLIVACFSIDLLR